MPVSLKVVKMMIYIAVCVILVVLCTGLEDADFAQFLSGNNDVLLEQLHQTHVWVTLGYGKPNMPPFEYVKALPKFNLVMAPTEKVAFDNFVEVCYSRYKSLGSPFGRGSVDIDPKFWVYTGMKAIVDTCADHKNTIVFPNGCCSNPNCPINKMYDIVLEELVKMNQSQQTSSFFGSKAF